MYVEYLTSEAIIVQEQHFIVNNKEMGEVRVKSKDVG